MRVQHARDALWRKRVAAVQSAWDAAREGNPTSVHRLRVASRRIREALPVIADGQRPGRVKRVRRKMRTLTRLLGPVRERDVSLSLLTGLEDKHPEDRPAIEAVRGAIAAERRELHQEVGRRLDSVRLEKLVRKLTRLAGRAAELPDSRHGRRSQKREASGEQTWHLTVAGRVVRRTKQLKQAIEQAGALYAPDRLHRVRVCTKKLRYALEVGHEARICRWQPVIRAVKELQDILGQLQDREVLLAHVRDVQVSHGDSSASAAVDRLTRLLEDNVRRYHAQFVSRRGRVLKLCAKVRQQASHAIPIGRPTPTRAVLRLKPPRVVLPLPRKGERVGVRG